MEEGAEISHCLDKQTKRAKKDEMVDKELLDRTRTCITSRLSSPSLLPLLLLLLLLLCRPSTVKREIGALLESQRQTMFRDAGLTGRDERM